MRGARSGVVRWTRRGRRSRCRVVRADCCECVRDGEVGFDFESWVTWRSYGTTMYISSGRKFRGLGALASISLFRSPRRARAQSQAPSSVVASTRPVGESSRSSRALSRSVCQSVSVHGCLHTAIPCSHPCMHAATATRTHRSAPPPAPRVAGPRCLSRGCQLGRHARSMAEDSRRAPPTPLGGWKRAMYAATMSP